MTDLHTNKRVTVWGMKLNEIVIIAVVLISPIVQWIVFKAKTDWRFEAVEKLTCAQETEICDLKKRDVEIDSKTVINARDIARVQEQSFSMKESIGKIENNIQAMRGELNTAITLVASNNNKMDALIDAVKTRPR